jgi:AcrR family transcriptional regulator
MPTADEYFVAAQELMAGGDPSQVTIGALCERVGTTSGSFYHHFGSHAGFVEALVADWVDRVERSLDRATSKAPDLAAVRRLIRNQTLHQPHQQEAAFRAWARTNPTVRAAVERVDEVRIDIGRSIVQGVAPDLDAKTAETYSQMAQLLLIGAQTRHPADAAQVAARSLGAFVALLEEAAAARSTPRSRPSP